MVYYRGRCETDALLAISTEDENCCGSLYVIVVHRIERMLIRNGLSTDERCEQNENDSGLRMRDMHVGWGGEGRGGERGILYKFHDRLRRRPDSSLIIRVRISSLFSPWYVSTYVRTMSVKRWLYHPVCFDFEGSCESRLIIVRSLAVYESMEYCYF